ncbi:MAG: hypothetical protein OEZ01_11745 [Candidatus Heimdallarchaeota archaeon]|nr:hypothetical protein [Candidatus Heimdallarchaeota archaeon]MDH5646676.1 hypothetical protein [Candidatus Heimdallarchaeota archaeon]
MKISVKENEIKDQFLLYNKIKNNIRKELLIFIYHSNRSYKELIEYTGLKPGSLYHHLNILVPLIEKIDHGMYQISDQGRQIVESNYITSKINQKPLVTNIETNDTPTINHERIEKSLDLDNEARSQNQSPAQNLELNLDQELKYLKDQGQNQELKHLKDQIPDQSLAKFPNQITSPPLEPPSTTFDTILATIWIQPSSYILILFVGAVSIILGFLGVSLAGSAIYVSRPVNPYLINITSFLLGILSLLLIEEFISKNDIYSKLKFIFIIRIISMLPGSIIGLSLLLLFYSGVTPPYSIYPIIFMITIIFGNLTATTGIYYLRNETIPNSIIYASIPSSIDLLLGVVILLSVNN